MLRRSRVKAKSSRICGAGRTVPTIALLLVMLLPSASRAQQSSERLPQVTIAKSPIPPGTVIDTHNWQQYKDYMQDGLRALFEGTYFWKFPPDFQLVIGRARHYPMPKQYVSDTEKYSPQVRIVAMPDGSHRLSGYVAGLPFPNPAEPLKAWKLLVDMWYVYNPHLQCRYNTFYTEDRFANVSEEDAFEVDRRLRNISDPGQPVDDPRNAGIQFSYWVQVSSPEESKYVTNLTLHYADPAKPVDVFLFIPALRRSLRLSSAARCAPLLGTDLAQDDAWRSNFNGNFEIFDGKVLREGYDIVQMRANLERLAALSNYYMPVMFPKPSVGKWTVRPVWVVDIRRIPSQSAGYCYGKKIFYVDKEMYSALWADAYDFNMKLWKLMSINQFEHYVPQIGLTVFAQQWTDTIWDVQNDHITQGMATNRGGDPTADNEECRDYHGKNYDNISRYSYSSGLSEILR